MTTYLPWHDYFWIAMVIASGILGLLLYLLTLKLLNKLRYGKYSQIAAVYSRLLIGPLYLFIPLVCINIVTSQLKNYLAIEFVNYLSQPLFIAAFAWFLINLVNYGEQIIKNRYNVNQSIDYRRRALRTQLQFVKKIAVGIILIVAIALVLLSYESVRRLGAGLLTSAGIIGALLAFAGQRVLANMFAGLQLAFSQSLRIDDAVVVANEFGNVEDITLTYVVIRTWDQRRLILPVNYFIENPFQNWTRYSTELIGIVFIYTDYGIAIDSVRNELNKILTQHPLWNQKTNVLQVTDANEKGLELRILVSADNAGDVWNLRCDVREKIYDFIRKNYSQNLPKIRYGAYIETK